MSFWDEKKANKFQKLRFYNVLIEKPKLNNQILLKIYSMNLHFMMN